MWDIFPNSQWHYWQDQKQLQESQTTPLPAPCCHLRFSKLFVARQMVPCHKNVLEMKLYFNEALLVLSQLNFLQEDQLHYSNEHQPQAHSPCNSEPAKTNQMSRDKETGRSANARGQVSNQSSPSFPADLCVNPEAIYPLEMGRGNWKVSTPLLTSDPN